MNGKTRDWAAALLGLLVAAGSVRAQNTAFTYQGRLNANDLPAHGLYDLRFSLYDALLNGTLRAGPTNLANVPVTNGTFTVSLNFGVIFNTVDTPALEIEVRPGGSVGAYTRLTPRQSIQPAPLALRASTADTITGTLADNKLSANIARLNANQTFTGNLNLNGPGNVGIGTATPSERLDVAGNARVSGDLSLNRGLTIDLPGANNGDLYPGLSFGSGSGEGIGSKRTAGGNRYGLDFYTAFFNRMTILNNGNVGIGTTQPEHLLDVSGTLATRGNLLVDTLNLNTGSALPGIVFGGFSSAETISSQRGTNGPNRWGLDFYTGNARRLSIANNGNVGIGVSAPQGKLDVDTGNGRIQFINDTVAGINVTGGGLPGFLRFRNTLEIWPSLDRSRAGQLDVRDTNGTPNITLRGNGTAVVKVLEVTGGSDVAEPFPMHEDNIEPGTVVVIDDHEPGRLRRSHQAYDTRVAGIVSGANGVQPGLSLRQHGRLDQGHPVALTGRVYAWADASSHPIRPGDLLTTSDTPGHLMNAVDRERRPGAVLGKAMTALPSGRGLVLVLVNLQ